MSQETHVALVGCQWIQIDERDSINYLFARCLRRPNKSEDISASGRVDRFMKHLSESRSRKGSPLKREYDGEADMIWRCVNINGKSQWVEVEWNDETPCKLWGFDSDSSDDESPPDSETRREEVMFENDSANKYGLESLRQQATTGPSEVTDRSVPRRLDAQPKRVSFGGNRIHEFPTSSDDERTVSFVEDSFLDDEEADDRRQCVRFGGLKTIESLEETRLRRRLLIPSTKGHNYKGCAESAVSSHNQTKRTVSFGSTTTVEIPEEFVTTIDKPKETGGFTTANIELKESADAATDRPDKGDAFSHLSTPLMDDKSVAIHFDGPKDIKSARMTTIKFAPITIVKEGPANHLSALKSFPDFCTASKPVFPPYHKREKACQRGMEKTPLNCSGQVESCMGTIHRSRSRPATFISFPRFI